MIDGDVAAWNPALNDRHGLDDRPRFAQDRRNERQAVRLGKERTDGTVVVADVEAVVIGLAAHQAIAVMRGLACDPTANMTAATMGRMRRMIAIQQAMKRFTADHRRGEKAKNAPRYSNSKSLHWQNHRQFKPLRRSDQLLVSSVLTQLSSPFLKNPERRDAGQGNGIGRRQSQALAETPHCHHVCPRPSGSRKVAFRSSASTVLG